MKSTQNNTATPRLLFLDDLRNPADCLNYMGSRKDIDVGLCSTACMDSLERIVEQPKTKSKKTEA